MTGKETKVAQQIKNILKKDSEKTKQVLVEFYEEDWVKLKALKEDSDVSWKDFFRAIIILSETLANVPGSEEVINSVVLKNET